MLEKLYDCSRQPKLHSLREVTRLVLCLQSKPSSGEPARDKNILDLFFTSNPTLKNVVEVQYGLGDHDMVRIETLLSPRTPRPFKRKVFLFSKDNFTDMKSDILKFGSSFLQGFHTRSFEENWNIVKTKLASQTEKYIPSKVKSTRNNLP